MTLRLGTLTAILITPVLATAAEAPGFVRALNEQFPKTRHWFAQAQSIRIDRTDRGFVPDWDTVTHRRVLRRDGAGQRLAPVLPLAANEAMVVGLDGHPGVWVRATSLDAAPVPGEAHEGLVVYRGAYGRSDALYKLTPTHVDEYVLVPDPGAPHEFRVLLQRGPDIGEVRASPTMIEFYDRAGVSRLRLMRPFARDALGKRRDGWLDLKGDLVSLRIDLEGLTFPVLIDPDWESTGRLIKERFLNVALAVPDGEVVTPGGCTLTTCAMGLGMPDCSEVLAQVERYAPASGTWRQAAPMTEGRFAYAGASLPQGRILVAGGCTEPGCTGTTASAEIYDSVADAWTPAAALTSPRAFATATPLPGGDVLVAGGCDLTGCTASAVIWDVMTSTWRSAPSMARGRGMHAATALADGRVLVTGGCTALTCAGILDRAEIYDPVANTWSPVGAMSTARAGHTVTRLLEGDVLVAGGCASFSCDPTLQSAERFSAQTSSFMAAPSMLEPRHDQTATLLADGTVLLAGGCVDSGSCTSTSEIYDPYVHTWSAGSMLEGERGYHAAAMLNDGRLLVTGGCNAQTCIPWSEIYPPTTPRDDAGPSTPDAGPYLPPDAGPPDHSDGCGCRATGRTDLGADGLLLLAPLLVLGRRRIRR